MLLITLLLTVISITQAAERPLQAHRKKQASSQQVYENSCQCLRTFFQNPDRQETFEDFANFIVTGRRGAGRQQLIPDKQGNILVSGQLVTESGTVHDFETATIQEVGAVTNLYDGNLHLGYDRDFSIKLKFTTVAVEGIKFVFVGEYLDDAEQAKLAKANENDYTVLQGVLTKYKNGQKIAEAKLSLVVVSRE